MQQPTYRVNWTEGVWSGNYRRTFVSFEAACQRFIELRDQENPPMQLDIELVH